MESFHWDSYFLTGLDEVDEQHQYLVALVNRFSTLLSENELDSEKVSSIFNELKSYSIYHFEEEETVMEKTGLAAGFIEKHKLVHQEFLQTVNQMSLDLKFDDHQVIKRALSFLTHWLVYHILGIDQDMAYQIKAVNQGVDPENAWSQQRHRVDNSTAALLNALNSLFHQVSERNKELVELNKTLESKVEKRTEALQEANQYLEYLAVTDPLTELPNRRYAMSQLELLWKFSCHKKVPLACLMIDVDHFKEVNDNYGHDCGDLVLVEVSQCLKDNLRSDDVLCRLGGDEFIVICENTDLTGAYQLAQQLCDDIAKLVIKAGDGAWYGSISVGVAVKQAEMQRVDQLIKAADEGVYLAKLAGKKCVRSIYETVADNRL